MCAIRRDRAQDHQFCVEDSVTGDKRVQTGTIIQKSDSYDITIIENTRTKSTISSVLLYVTVTCLLTSMSCFVRLMVTCFLALRLCSSSSVCEIQQLTRRKRKFGGS
jgi:hypothetical protein